MKLAIALLLLPIKWVLCWHIAILVHELFHYVAIIATGGKVGDVQITTSGILMNAELTANRQEFLCALAGPLGSFLLALLVTKAPILGACGIIQLMMNLLPIYPLDGGRVLSCVLLRVIPRHYMRVTQTISLVFRIILLLLGVYLSFMKSAGLLPIIIAATIAIRNMKINIPCKRLGKRVQ